MTLLRTLSLLLAVADGLTAITDKNIKNAVAAWLADSKKAEVTYGDISAWDVSRVTAMSQLFLFQDKFNADISKWDTSKVTSMPFMRAHSVANSFRRAPRRDPSARRFWGATAFNADISKWDTSKVTSMRMMFKDASAFDQDLLAWDTSKLKSVDDMFTGATKYKCADAQKRGKIFKSRVELRPGTSQTEGALSLFRFQEKSVTCLMGHPSDWDVSRVKDFSELFNIFSDWNVDISKWDTSSATSMRAMFYHSDAFSKTLLGWDTSKVTDMSEMFRGADVFSKGIDTWDTSRVTPPRPPCFYSASQFLGSGYYDEQHVPVRSQVQLRHQSLGHGEGDRSLSHVPSGVRV